PANAREACQVQIAKGRRNDPAVAARIQRNQAASGIEELERKHGRVAKAPVVGDFVAREGAARYSPFQLSKRPADALGKTAQDRRLCQQEPRARAAPLIEEHDVL